MWIMKAEHFELMIIVLQLNIKNVNLAEPW